MKSFKEQCVRLRKKDLTLSEIVRITKRPKTSVWFHIKDFPLSKMKQKQIAEESVRRLLKHSLLRKGKSRREFKKISKWNKESIYLVAHLLFDGQIYRTSCIYSNRNEVLINRVENCMKLLYEYEPKKRVQESGVVSVSYHNVALTNYLKSKSIELLHRITEFPVEFKRSFLCAFFDDEGCMDFQRRRKRVRGYQHDHNILKLIQRLLKVFYIESVIRKKHNEIVVSRKENLIKFRSEINFSPGVKINGKRKNSIWKKDLEKRKILDMAIASYK